MDRACGGAHVERGVKQHTKQQAAAPARFYEGVVEEVVAAAEAEHDGTVRLRTVTARTVPRQHAKEKRQVDGGVDGEGGARVTKSTRVREEAAVAHRNGGDDDDH
jgi:uncharacterized protein YcnI